MGHAASLSSTGKLRPQDATAVYKELMQTIDEKIDQKNREFEEHVLQSVSSRFNTAVARSPTTLARFYSKQIEKGPKLSWKPGQAKLPSGCKRWRSIRLLKRGITDESVVQKHWKQVTKVLEVWRMEGIVYLQSLASPNRATMGTRKPDAVTCMLSCIVLNSHPTLHTFALRYTIGRTAPEHHQISF